MERARQIGMKRSILLMLFLLALVAPARGDYRELVAIAHDPAIDRDLRDAVHATVKAFPAIAAEDVAVSVVDLTDPARIVRGDYHGDVPFYPASVIKLFYMADVYAIGKETIGDVDRALKEMIVVSDNDATAYIVDILADTAPGTELQGDELAQFVVRRRSINRRFEALGYGDRVSAMMKPWSFGPYGRELQLLGENRVNRNKLTANATAALLTWIVRGRAPHAAAQMELMHRPLAPARTDENQVDEFIGEALPTSSKLWSKSGWTSEVRHDAAYVELPNGRKLVLVIFTRGTGDKPKIIPAITRNVLAELGGGVAE